MQGFNYQQLYAAMQSWPVKASADYLTALNRLIFLGELRLARDLDLEYFDPTDVTPVTVTFGQETLSKPPQSQGILFTSNPGAGATSDTLTAPWGGPNGIYTVTLADGQTLVAMTLTNGSTSATWPSPPGGPIPGQTAANAQVNAQFVVERDLTVVYGGAIYPLVKRSPSFVRLYSNAPNGQPLYYAELDVNTWMLEPAADSNTSGIIRHWVERPISIVVAGNTYFGDNFGDCLFSCALMEAEHFLKADDRYQDMLTKYVQQLLPNARDEARVATRRGDYAPLAAAASLPAPPMPAAAPAPAG